jgi:hypothetical protein
MAEEEEKKRRKTIWEHTHTHTNKRQGTEKQEDGWRV